jgi:N-acetylglutamate synthase-like GNAT family acetyltransferase
MMSGHQHGLPISALLIVSIFVAAATWAERMRFMDALRALFHRRTHLRLDRFKPLPKGIAMRIYRPDDREGCLGLYRDNEVGRFPLGFTRVYEDFLDRNDYLKLVFTDENDVAVAIGGIGLQPYLATHCAWLVFGLVSPAWQGRGIGAALLASRVASLPEPSSSTRLFMTNVPKSNGYFQRFGFSSQGSSGRLKLPCNSALLNAEAWRDCRKQVSKLGLSLPQGVVPKVDMRRPLPALELQAGARGWTRLSKLDEAVLIQSGGVILFLCLLIAARAYSWLAGLLVVWGGLLYRRELRRRQAEMENNAQVDD